MSSPERERSYKAVVQKVIEGGPHGPYAVATSEKIDGSVTFSLEPAVWTENDYPQEGFRVILSDIRSKRAGWRAHNARFERPSDKS